MRVQSALLPLLFAPLPALAAAFDGAELSLLWGIPFAMVLLSIAIGPLLMPRMWHHYFGPMVQNWEARRAVPKKAKYLAFSMMTFSCLLLLWRFPAQWWIAAVSAAFCLSVAVWMWRLPDA